MTLTAVTRRGVPSADELRAMQILAATHPDRATHATDLPYRLAWRHPDRHDRVATALWYAGGELVGWAVWSPGGRGVELAAHPAYAAAVGSAALAWGEAHARGAPATEGEGERPSWWVSARADDAGRIALLEAAGFRPEAWTLRRYERALDAPPPAPALPDGFALRPLRGAVEAPAYVAAHRAAFGSTFMTEAWRQQILRAPGYAPDLDLVVVAPDGRVAAFAVLWLSPAAAGRREGQFEPVGTRPEFRRLGLARALLLEGMRRLRAAGATHALVETEDVREAANGLYRAVLRDSGVRTRYYRKDP
jgi:ribosomal protein S18 acetylase RimI-like enzyme